MGDDALTSLYGGELDFIQFTAVHIPNASATYNEDTCNSEMSYRLCRLCRL